MGPPRVGWGRTRYLRGGVVHGRACVTCSGNSGGTWQQESETEVHSALPSFKEINISIFRLVSHKHGSDGGKGLGDN